MGLQNGSSWLGFALKRLLRDYGNWDKALHYEGPLSMGS
jgi:hypothetical protein